jgi:proteasome lid subunit RPN8/RPN11
MISLEQLAEHSMITDAIESFPDECCGFFYGNEDASGNRRITHALPVNNAKEGDKRKRFEISPKDYLGAERFAEENGLQLLGVYHSHPNHPAIPSEQDRLAAQPYFSYIIVSVHEQDARDIRSWRLNDDFKFEEEVVGKAIHQLINK